jgi:hypothetical protein
VIVRIRVPNINSRDHQRSRRKCWLNICGMTEHKKRLRITTGFSRKLLNTSWTYVIESISSFDRQTWVTTIIWVAILSEIKLWGALKSGKHLRKKAPILFFRTWNLTLSRYCNRILWAICWQTNISQSISTQPSSSKIWRNLTIRLLLTGRHCHNLPSLRWTVSSQTQASLTSEKV